jgi:hypothetical protein
MMYSDRLVVVIKVDGKVLRESGDVVTLPFNSEYEVFIKNMNSVRAMVKVTVDGVDATEGCKLIVDANDSTSLERFIKNGNFKRGNRFKFIERTSKIEEHRGIGVEDGLIRIEYWFEQLPPRVEKRIISHEHHHHDYPWNACQTYTLGGVQPGITWTCGAVDVNNVQTTPTSNLASSGDPISCFAMNASSVPVPGDPNMPHSAFTMSFAPAPEANDGLLDFMETSLNDAGITVPGSESRQSFQTGAWFPTETESHVLVIKLKGKVGEKRVIQAVTVDRKPVCSTCGHTNKANSKFCSECGTALELI